MVSARILRFIALGALGASVGALAASTARAQDAKGEYVGVTTAVRFDISPALRDLPPDLAEPLCNEQPDDRGPGAVVTGPGDIDTAVQVAAGAPRIPAPLVSFDTLTGSARPPDPVGDVGPTQYVPMANSKFAVYSKTGTLLSGPFNINTLFTGFGGACETENPGDPVVIYDQLADRWLLSQFTVAGPTYYNCVALSTSGDATGTYYRYAFTTGSYFGDYPKYGMWPDAYYISTRELNGAAPGMGIYAANRAQMIAGNPAAQLMTFRVPIGSTARYNIGDGFLPSDMDGTTPPPAGSPNYYVGTMDTGFNGAPQDALTLWKFHVDWTTPANSTFTMTNTIPTAAFDSNFPCSGRNCIPQPGTAQRIDILGYRQRPTFRLAYRNFGTHESLVTNQSVEAATAMAGARWYEVRSPNSSPVIFQQGTYAPGITDGIHRWMGSIAMDQAGNMALGFSASDGTATFPSVWYTGRLATDPLGTMPQGEGHIMDGTGSQSSTSGRWGDYTAMTVDPTDDCTFWYINEYFLSGSQVWRLRVGSFKLSPCGSSSTTNVDVITGPGPGPSNAPQVLGFNANGSSNGITNFSAYSVSQYGANVALANYRTDTTPFAADILTGPGPGAVFGPQVKGFARDGTAIGKVNFFAYGTLKYGVNVDSGNVDGEPYEEILTAPGPGDVFGPHVRGWSFDNDTLTAIAKISFFAFSTLKYGARAVGGEVDNDAYSEILCAPGPAVAFGSQIRGFNFDNTTVVSMAKVNFVPFTTSYGAHVAAGDLDKDGIEEILAAPGPDPSATSRIRGYNCDGGTPTSIPAIDFDGVPGTNRYGATVDAADLDGDLWAEIVAGTGYDPTAAGTSRFKGWNYDQTAAVTPITGLDLTAYAGTTYGVNVAIDEIGP